LNEPRNQCLDFLRHHGAVGIPLPKSEFDALARSGSFAVGPYRDTFGDGPGEPYIPDRQAFGELKDGRCVYCELAEERP
jgi:hypothetical protein